MAQTPISASVFYNSTTPVTIYTVPSTRTAVVKTVMAASLTGSLDNVTLNKVSGGVTYPLVRNQPSGYAGSSSNQTYYAATPGNQAINLLSGPITLSAGDSISLSTSGTPTYLATVNVSNSNYLINNINYVNGYYVVVGFDAGLNKGLILTSPDGITWTKQTFPDNVTLNDIAYGASTYVVTNGTTGTVHYSTNLTSWTSVSLPSFTSGQVMYTAFFGGGNFVIGGASGQSFYSTNGTSWTKVTTNTKTDTINAFILNGSNYIYCTTGVNYYTSNFTAFTYPYNIISTYSLNRNGSIAASNSLLIATTTNTIGTGAGTQVYYTSTDGVTWTVGTFPGSGSFGYSFDYAVAPFYLYNGYYYLFMWNNYTSGAYLRSSSGTGSWVADNASYTGYNSSGNAYPQPLYDRYSSTYGNYVSAIGGSSYNHAIYYFNSSGGYQSQTMYYLMSSWQSGDMTFSAGPCIVGNPYDGSWNLFGYYSQGANYASPFYYGADQNTTGTYNSGWYAPGFPGAGYFGAAGVVPNSPRYLVGSTNGWLFNKTSYGAGSSAIFGGNQYFVSNLNAAFWGKVSSVPVAYIGRNGDASSSTLLVVWENGNCAVSTDQAVTWTTSSIGFGGIAGSCDMRYGTRAIAYGNGKWWATNNSNQVASSTDGLTWTTMISSVDNAYVLNSQNVYITSSGIVTSPTSSLTFTTKTSTSYAGTASVRRMAYVGSTYYMMPYNSSTLYSSSDLSTWAYYSFGTPTVNANSYFYGNLNGLAYSGSGSNIVLSNAVRNATSSSTFGLVSNLINPIVTPTSSYLVVGNATAGIVEIS
jgi:hypothetical protein